MKLEWEVENAVGNEIDYLFRFLLLSRWLLFFLPRSQYRKRSSCRVDSFNVNLSLFECFPMMFFGTRYFHRNSLQSIHRTAQFFLCEYSCRCQCCSNQDFPVFRIQGRKLIADEHIQMLYVIIGEVFPRIIAHPTFPKSDGVADVIEV